MTTMNERDKLRVMLPHWIEHNAEHATEFRLWAKLAGEAEVDIESAAAQMEAANEALTAALEKLDGPLGQHSDHAH